MKSILNECIERIQNSRKSYRKHLAVFLMLAVVTAVGVNWGLHQNGISMTAGYNCGKTEHKHDDSCYTKVLTCGQSETAGTEGHTHTEACYTTQTTFVCAQAEHTHSESCYDENGNLVCGQAEHIHNDSCYATEQVLTCGQEESAGTPGHTHTDACYEKQFTCTIEEHTHSIECLSDSTADLETAADWEKNLPKTLSGKWADDLVNVAKTQIGYKESNDNFKVLEDGSTGWYTRYGAWYGNGNEYGKWSSTFAAFCLHYANIPTEKVPINADFDEWLKALDQAGLYKAKDGFTPEAGDMVILDNEDNDQIADHVGIIEKVISDENTTTLYVIEPESNGEVKENQYNLSAASILGYVELPENPDYTGEAEPAPTDTENNDNTDIEEAPSEEPTDEAANTEENTEGEENEEETDETEEPAETATLTAEVSTADSLLKSPAADANGTKLFEIGETAATTLTVSNPAEAALTETDGSVIRMYMNLTAAEPAETTETVPEAEATETTETTEEEFTSADTNIEETPSEETTGETTETPAADPNGIISLAPGSYTAEAASGSVYTYTVTAVGENFYCIEAERPINGDTYSIQVNSVFAEGTNGGTNEIWAVTLTPEEKEALDAASETGYGIAEKAADGSNQQILKWTNDETDTSYELVSEETSQTVETENYTVTVTYGSETMLPKDAELRVVEYSADSEEFQKVIEETGVTPDWLLDISFYYQEEEIEPQAEISISVTGNSKDGLNLDEDGITKITHFAESGTEILEGDQVAAGQNEDGNDEISFQLDSLSLVYGTTYHQANVTTESNYAGDTGYGKDFLIYTVSGNYVYFLAYDGDTSTSSPVTFKVALDSNVQIWNKATGNTATASLMSTLNSATLYQGSVAGTVINANGNQTNKSLNWENLLWHHNGHDRGADGSLRAKAKSGSSNYLLIQNGSLSFSYWQDVYSEQGSSSTYTRFNEQTTTTETRAVTKYWLGIWPYISYETVTVINYNYLSFDGTKMTGAFYSEVSGTNPNPSSSCNMIIAEVGTDYTPTDSGTPSGGNGKAVYTGKTTTMPLAFYTVQVTDNNTLDKISGVGFTIYNEDGDVVGKITTKDAMRVDITGFDLEPGKYTMKMTYVPDGYVCDSQTWSFTIDGAEDKTLNLVSANGESTGVIIVNKEENLTMDKEASVVDYANRTYKVDLEAQSELLRASIDNLTVNFVVDQSNSMLFPSGLESTGKTVNVSKTGKTYTDSSKTRDFLKFDSTVFDSLDKSEIYYIVADPTGSSTVYALYYSGSSWWFQDASYYAKAIYRSETTVGDYSHIRTGDTIYLPSEKHDCSASGKDVSNGSHSGFGSKCHGGKATNKSTEDGFGGCDITAGTYTIYKATDEYNRLHYLEQSLCDMMQMLAAINPNAQVTLDMFTSVNKDDGKDWCHTYTLGTQLEDALASVGTITTEGGTRQDRALKHVYENHVSNYSGSGRQFVILITDGAPVSSGKSGDVGYINPVGEATDTANKDGSAYERINYWAGQIKGKTNSSGQRTVLATVGLGMRDVTSGSKSMRYISTNGPSTNTTTSATSGEWWFQPDNSSDLMSILTDTILKQIVSTTKDPADRGTVVDYISDSFYPVDQNGNAVKSGTRIDTSGNVVSSGGVGTILYGTKDGITGWYVEWDQTVVSGTTTKTVTTTDWYQGDTTRKYDWWGNAQDSYRSDGRYYTWQTHDGVTAYWATSTRTSTEEVDNKFQGTVYLKAKEDFIGGNAIKTNKKATLSLKSATDTKDGAVYEFPVPDVNVRLLDMTSMETEVTVYKGDTINQEGTEYGSSPLDSMKNLFDNVSFKKIVENSTGDTYNKVGKTEADGVYGDTFSLVYAIGSQLTDEQWKELMKTTTDQDGNEIPSQIQIPYTYNDADGKVGYFTISLEKTSVENQTADWSNENHAADVANGAPNSDKSNWIEKYTLKVTYTAYKLGENGRPSANKNNGSAGPGTEVGKTDSSGNQVNNTLETGKGIVESNNFHKVYAIDGTIRVYKEITEDLKSSEDKTYTFKLYRQTTDSDGNTVNTEIDPEEVKQITIKANTTSSANYASGNYVEWTNLERGTYLVVESDGDEFILDTITVKDTTNCQSSNDTTNKTLTFTMGNNTSGDNVIGKAGDALYTSYVDSPNGVLGEATFKNKKREYTADIPVEKIWDDGAEQHTRDTVYVILGKGVDENAALVTKTIGEAPNTETVYQVLKLDASNNWKGTFSVALSNKDERPTDYWVKELKDVQNSSAEGHANKAEVVNGSNSYVYFGDSDLISDKEVVKIGEESYQVTYSTADAAEVKDESGNITSDDRWTIHGGTADKGDGVKAEVAGGKLVVKNAKAYEIPKTGGAGTTMFTIGGVLLMGIGLLYGYSLRRRREGGEN